MTRPGLQERALSSGFSVLTSFNNRKSDLSWGWAQVDIGWSVPCPVLALGYLHHPLFWCWHCDLYWNTMRRQVHEVSATCLVMGWSEFSHLQKMYSVQFGHSVISDSLWPHGLQHTRLPCLSPTSRACSTSSSWSQWCHSTISSSVVPFSSHLQSFPASGFFQISQLFTSGGQRIGVSASASVLPMNNQDWSPLGWTGWISLQSKGLSGVFSNTTAQKHQFFGAQLSL